jgi:hypothetical protein
VRGPEVRFRPVNSNDNNPHSSRCLEYHIAVDKLCIGGGVGFFQGEIVARAWSRPQQIAFAEGASFVGAVVSVFAGPLVYVFLSRQISIGDLCGIIACSAIGGGFGCALRVGNSCSHDHYSCVRRSHYHGASVAQPSLAFELAARPSDSSLSFLPHQIPRRIFSGIKSARTTRSNK